MKYPTVPTHISLIRPGDVVEVDGTQRTVCPANLKRGGFMGTTLWGDSYRCGTVPVQRAVMPNAAT